MSDVHPRPDQPPEAAIDSTKTALRNWQEAAAAAAAWDGRNEELSVLVDRLCSATDAAVTGWDTLAEKDKPADVSATPLSDFRDTYLSQAEDASWNFNVLNLALRKAYSAADRMLKWLSSRRSGDLTSPVGTEGHRFADQGAHQKLSPVPSDSRRPNRFDGPFGIVLHFDSRKVTRGDVSADFGDKTIPWRIVEVLAKGHSDDYYPTDQLIQSVWPGLDGGDKTADNLRPHLVTARTIIKPLGLAIKNLRKIGYRLVDSDSSSRCES